MVNPFRTGLFGVAFALFLPLSLWGQEGPQPVDLVNPHVDAANSRWFFFSSASRPFGMVNLSPDNLVEGTWGTGYRYNVDTIRGFSHIHAWQLSGISVMPMAKKEDGRKGPDAYASTFSHTNERVEPGYHYVLLNRGEIDVELTSTTRVGFHRYTFPKAQKNYILFNLGGNLGPSEMIEGALKQVNDQEIEGHTVNGPTRRRPKPAPVYFVAQFSHPIKSLSGWQGKQKADKIKEVSGKKSGGILGFSTKIGESVLMKIGISYVSIEQARLNLTTELPHWDFDQVVKESREEWNDWLGKIQIEGGKQPQQQRFYTDLWHALQGRRIISDVNGKYMDMTGAEPRVGQIPLDPQGKPLFNHYNSDSFWGAQWTLNTLWHLVYPKVSEEFCQSMLLMYQDGGLIPRGPSGGNYTYVMTGASTTPFIVSAYLKGIRGFDIELAYEGLRKNHLPGGIMGRVGYEHDTQVGGGIENYMRLGYVPYPPVGKSTGFHQDGGGQTLEYAYQDWCLGQLAKELGKEADYEMFRLRSENYKNLYDSQTGWMRPKDIDGNWYTPFDPLKYDDGWVEATAAASTWFVPHDVAGLIQLMGGRGAFIQKLNRSFELAAEHGFVNPNKQDRDKYINYGNQPSMQTGHLFTYAGAPWLTQYWIREVIDSVYSGTDPYSGYSGDEDQGLMGALAVLMKIGLFSMDGGTSREPFYEITAPIFDKITIQLDERYYPGGSFVIETINNSPENRYIESVKLNEEALEKAWFYHKDLIKGGSLQIELGAEPNREWGSGSTAIPPPRLEPSRN